MNTTTHILRSEKLLVEISENGAELISVKDAVSNFEFMWQADPKIWNRHAPVLFPIVGKLNNNRIKISGKNFEMGQHGFARDQVFEPIEMYTDLIRLMLSSSDVSLEKYPYEFRFFTTYYLNDNTLRIEHKVINVGAEEMYFSLGAHPGFSLPKAEMGQYKIEFEQAEVFERHLLQDGLFTGKTESMQANGNLLPLSNSLFEKDAIVFKNLKSKWLKLVRTDSNYSIQMNFEGFPFMGIWTKPGQEEFICLEPWLGIADSVGFTGDISDKEGIRALTPNAEISFHYDLIFTAG